jgi:hypothetical protein
MADGGGGPRAKGQDKGRQKKREKKQNKKPILFG